MTNSRSTKSALFTSVVAILLCCTMLLGTTFAWFTDEAKSTNNVIQAGNLDVKVSYVDAKTGEWTELKADSKVFNEEALYEPGYTETVWFKVENAGSLAFKHQMSLNVVSETAGVNQAGNQFNLSDYLVAKTGFATANYEESKAMYNTRESLNNFAFKDDSLSDKTALVYTNNVLWPKENADSNPDTWYYLVVLQMPTTVGNEANHNGTDVPKINLGVEVLATQVPSESDTFGPDYDADADYVNHPLANVGKLENNNVPATWGIRGSEVEGGLDLDVAYKFLAPENEKQVENSPYRWYHADFVVKADADVAADSVALAGYYEVWCDGFNDGRWVALTAGEDIPAGTEIRLVEGMGGGAITVNYSELCQYSYTEENGVYIPTKGFQCGAADLTGENAGTTLTVELRLYETTADPSSTSGDKNIETGEYITVGTFTYTF